MIFSCSGGAGASQLLKACLEVIDTFDPKETAADAHMQDAEALKDEKMSETDLKFIHQVFNGCMRYQKFLRPFVTSFLSRFSASANAADQTLYTVLAYLLFFQLEQLGLPGFLLVLTCGLGTPKALRHLIMFTLSAEELAKGTLRAEWCKVYDANFIDRDVLEKVWSYAEDLRGMLQKVDPFLLPGQTREKRPTTSAVPFNLSAGKQRPPEAEVFVKQIAALPVPDAVRGERLAQFDQDNQRRREEERARVAAKYSAAEEFQLNTAKRLDGDEKAELVKKVDAERMAECTFQPKVRDYVAAAVDAVMVRQNLASVLREDALLRQKQANEYETLKRYGEDLRDASEFLQWQEDMKRKDILEEEKRMQQRVIEAQVARESAIEALESQVRKKQLLADHQRQEQKADQELRAKEEVAEVESKQKLVRELQEERECARIAEAKETKFRAEQAEQMRREMEAAAEQKRLEDQEALEKRKDLIRQIRALDKIPSQRAKKFDATEVLNHGLLEEMSHAELWDFLTAAKERHAKELESKRERLVEQRSEKQQDVAEKVEAIAKVRSRAKEESKQRSEAARRKARELDEAKQACRDERLAEMAEKMRSKKQQKREEELRLKRGLGEALVRRQSYDSSPGVSGRAKNASSLGQARGGASRSQDPPARLRRSLPGKLEDVAKRDRPPRPATCAGDLRKGTEATLRDDLGRGSSKCMQKA